MLPNLLPVTIQLFFVYGLTFVLRVVLFAHEQTINVNAAAVIVAIFLIFIVWFYC
jgi:hypothetical protein